MVDVRPFRALRFDSARLPDLSQVVCPPYDVITPSEQLRLHQRHPHNLVRLELGLDAPDDDEQRSRYTRAAETLKQWRGEGVLIPDSLPSFYLHLESFSLAGEQRERRDLIAAVRLADWSERQVLPHERTMERPKEDRFRLLQATATQLSPVWALFHEPSEALDRAWRSVQGRRPDHAFADDEGRHHRLWALTDPALASDITRDFEARRLYIADGHHRYETALHYRNLRRPQGEADPPVRPQAPDAPYEFVMTWLTAADDRGLAVLPTHRLLHSSRGLDLATVEKTLSPCLRLDYIAVSARTPGETAAALLREMERRSDRHVMGIYGPDPARGAVLTTRDAGALQQALPADRSAPWRELDVAVLHTLVVQPLLDSEGDQQALSYTRDPIEACRAVQQGQAQLALLLRPTPVSEVLAVAEAGDRMPEKSTYFHPKPPTGLVLYPLTS